MVITRAAGGLRGILGKFITQSKFYKIQLLNLYPIEGKWNFNM